jgi:hypothetical protein
MTALLGCEAVLPEIGIMIFLRRIPRSFRPSQPKRLLRRSRLLRGVSLGLGRLEEGNEPLTQQGTFRDATKPGV